jgi:hypothetical protein
MDHLNEPTPEHRVIKSKHRSRKLRAMPYFRTPTLRAGEIPGVRTQTLPDTFTGWEYWICDWTDKDMAAMNVVADFVADEKYIDQWPDAWFMDGLYLNAKARETFEKHAPDKCLFFPMRIFSKQTGEPLDAERWIAYPRHWLQVDGDDLPLPDCDFSPGTSHGSEIFRAAQRSPEVRSFLNELGLFSWLSGGNPVYSAALFGALK